MDIVWKHILNILKFRHFRKVIFYDCRVRVQGGFLHDNSLILDDHICHDKIRVSHQV